MSKHQYPISTAKQVTIIIPSPGRDQQLSAAAGAANSLAVYSCDRIDSLPGALFVVAADGRFYYTPFPTKFFDHHVPGLKA